MIPPETWQEAKAWVQQNVSLQDSPVILKWIDICSQYLIDKEQFSLSWRDGEIHVHARYGIRAITRDGMKPEFRFDSDWLTVADGPIHRNVWQKSLEWVIDNEPAEVSLAAIPEFVERAKANFSPGHTITTGDKYVILGTTNFGVYKIDTLKMIHEWIMP